jgi:hypothetical protein
MPGNAILYRMDSGYAGAVGRVHDATVEAQLISPTPGQAPTAYGMGVVIDAVTGGIRVPTAADPAAPTGIAYGLYVRPWPTQDMGAVGNPMSVPRGSATPPSAGITHGVLKRGYMTVLLTGAVAAVKGAPVYVWKAAAAGGQVPGSITADGSTPGNVMLLPGYFMGPADPNGITEVAVNI